MKLMLQRGFMGPKNRVIARLIKERDSARISLSEYKATYSSTGKSQTHPAPSNEVDVVMETVNDPLPADVIALFAKTASDLSDARRLKKSYADLKTPEELSEFTVKAEIKTLNTAKDPAVTTLSLNNSMILATGMDGTTSILDATTHKVPNHLPSR